MGFSFTQTELEGVIMIKPHIFTDTRGIYKKIYFKNDFVDNVIDTSFSESSFIYSKKGCVRGLHFQTVDSQGKLIHVVKGSIYDVIVDLRPKSKTFTKHIEILLRDRDNILLYIPPGFAHGFQSLNESIFFYQSTGKYNPEYCGGINWMDKDLNIKWPILDNVIVSEKDAKLPALSEILESKILYD